MTEQTPHPPQDGQNPPPQPAPAEERPPIGETVGTGTSIALGCIAATLLLIVLGLLFIVVVAVLN